MTEPSKREQDRLAPILDDLRKAGQSEGRIPLVRKLIDEPNAINRLTSMLMNGRHEDRLFAARVLYDIHSVASDDAKDPAFADKAAKLDIIAQAPIAPLTRALWYCPEPDIVVNDIRGERAANDVKTTIIFNLIEIGGRDQMRSVASYFDNRNTDPLMREYIASTIESRLTGSSRERLSDQAIGIIRDWMQRIADSDHEPDTASNQMITGMIGKPEIRKILFPLEGAVPRRQM